MQNKTNQTESVGKMLQENGVKPLQSFATSIIVGLFIVIAGAFVYKKMTGRTPSKEALSFLGAIVIGLCMLGLLRSL